VMGGVELARQLAERGRLVPVLLISGYVPEQAMAEKRWPLLQKPFTNDMLLDAVNRLLYFNDANGMRRG
jgi:FixJ family two-component response regulator